MVTQYASTSHQKILKRHGLTPSQNDRLGSRKGSYLDKAPMESFLDSMKSELVQRTRFATREDAKRPLFWWIESFFNRQPRNSSIGYRTPAQARLIDRHRPGLASGSNVRSALIPVHTPSFLRTTSQTGYRTKPVTLSIFNENYHRITCRLSRTICENSL